MELSGKTVVITGAGNGIGAALARRIAAEDPRGIVVADIDAPSADRVAAEVRATGVPAIGHRADVGDPGQAAALVEAADAAFGPVDVVCSNAGVAAGSGVHADDQRWEQCWSVNVMAHVYLARAVLPGMMVRRSGYLLITASAAGLLGLPGDAPYSVTKHAAVGLAEWLAADCRSAGIRVSALCPLGVRTDLLMTALAAGHPAARAVAESGAIVEPADVAECAVRGMAEERLLILPHAEVGEQFAKKAADPDGWLADLQRAGS